MWVFTEVADWIDSRTKSANQVLDQAIESSNYSETAMITAATTHAFMQFGASVADVLRLGDGVKQGGVSGFTNDGLRFVAIFPLGKATKIIKQAKATREARLIRDPDPCAGICTWVATTKALRQTGHQNGGKFYAEVEDLAQAVGTTIKREAGLTLDELLNLLKKVGAKPGSAVSITRMEQVIAGGLLKRDGSVLMIGVACLSKGKK